MKIYDTVYKGLVERPSSETQRAKVDNRWYNQIVGDCIKMLRKGHEAYCFNDEQLKEITEFIICEHEVIKTGNDKIYRLRKVGA